MIPSVSFLIATYNRVNYIDKCIDSILSQSLKDYEIIVVDDCSDDGTQELIKSKYKNMVIYHRNYINRGVSFARNIALDYASGKYIGLIDSDDILYSSRYLEIALNIFNIYPTIDVFCCDTFCIDTIGNKIGSQTFLNKTIDYNGIKLSSKMMDFEDMFLYGVHSCGALVRKEIIKKTGFLNTNYRIGWDEDFFLRVAAYKPKAIYYYNEPLTGYRQHSDSNLSSNVSLLYLERIRCRREILQNNKFLNNSLGYKANKRFAELYLCLIDAYIKEENIKASAYTIIKSLLVYPLILPKLLKHGLSFFVKIFGLKI